MKADRVHFQMKGDLIWRLICIADSRTVVSLQQHWGDILTGGGGREGGGGGGGSLMTWINRKRKNWSAGGHKHTLRPYQDPEEADGADSWQVTQPNRDVPELVWWRWHRRCQPSAGPSPRWLPITRILLVNQHQRPPVQNKEKLKINLLTGESLGRALQPV